jgi:hypothetical protein
MIVPWSLWLLSINPRVIAQRIVVCYPVWERKTDLTWT